MRHTHALPTLLLAAGSALAQPTPPQISTEPVFGTVRFRAATHLTHANDQSGRLFVAERRGVIYALSAVQNPATDTPTKTVFLDISSQVRSTSGNEEGLLSMAFHPRFADNGFVFVAYTTGTTYQATATSPVTPSTVRTRISRFTVKPGTQVTQQVFLEVPKRFFNHNGGQLAFGRDGMLYISTGDGGGAGDPERSAQNRRSLKGKILRINVDVAGTGTPYSIPTDNPFVASTTAMRGEIWAYGLRNPWRFSFDRSNGEMWCGDVGQDVREEVDVIRRGGNYGWSQREGTRVFNTSVTALSPIRPVIDYAIGASNGRSVIGGFVYRGTRIPSLVGSYIYADFFSGKVWALKRVTGADPTNRLLLTDANLSVSSFGEDPAGELYLVSYKEDGTGRILRLKEGTGGGGGGGGIIGVLDPTFANVKAIFSNRCTGCHGGNQRPNLLPANAHAAIVNRPSLQLASMDYVEPGNADASYLFRKVMGTHLSAGGSGSRMPLGSPLTAADRDLISRWIAAGAPNN